MKRKRLLLINYEFPPFGGGGGRVTDNLAHGFLSKGFDVDIITSRFFGQKKYEIRSGINIYRTLTFFRKEKSVANFASMLSFLFSGFFCGVKLCLKHDYAAINTHFVLPTGPLGYILSRIFKIKNILSIHGGDVFDPSKKSSPHRHFLLKISVSFFIRNANIVIVHSSDVKERIEKNYKVKDKKIHIIALPYTKYVFSSQSREKLGLSKSKKYLIGIGRLVDRKNFSYFLEILSTLNDSYCGIIIGEGPKKKELVEMCKRLKIDNRIIFAGSVSEDRKFQYLEAADAFLLTSLHEGFGIVVQEAMQVGLPIIAINKGGHCDFVEDGINGVLINENENETVKKIEKLFLDEERVLCIQRNNKDKIKEFSLDRVIGKYLKLL